MFAHVKLRGNSFFSQIFLIYWFQPMRWNPQVLGREGTFTNNNLQTLQQVRQAVLEKLGMAEILVNLCANNALFTNMVCICCRSSHSRESKVHMVGSQQGDHPHTMSEQLMKDAGSGTACGRYRPTVPLILTGDSHACHKTLFTGHQGPSWLLFLFVFCFPLFFLFIFHDCLLSFLVCYIQSSKTCMY